MLYFLLLLPKKESYSGFLSFSNRNKPLNLPSFFQQQLWLFQVRRVLNFRFQTLQLHRLDPKLHLNHLLQYRQ